MKLPLSCEQQRSSIYELLHRSKIGAGEVKQKQINCLIMSHISSRSQFFKDRSGVGMKKNQSPLTFVALLSLMNSVFLLLIQQRMHTVSCGSRKVRLRIWL